MVSINASHAAAAAHLPTGQGHGQRPSSSSTAPSSSEIVDTVDLSPEAEAVVESGEAPAGPGNSANSPAHQARALLFAAASDEHIPFGHIVRDIARGITPTVGTETPPADEGDGEVGDATETGTDGETPLVVDDGLVEDELQNDGTGSGDEGSGGISGGNTADPELLAEATLIEELLNANEEEDETLL